MTNSPEPTLNDLFRVLNGMRDEVSELRRGIKELRCEVSGIRDEVKSLRDEFRDARHDFGQDFDVIKARMTVDKASLDEILTSLHRDLSRHSTITKSTLDSHTARFRTVDGKLDELKDQGRTIVQRLDRAHVPVG